MRNGIINGNSPKEDIVGALTGVWNEYDSGSWHVVVTPFFTVLSGTLQPGTHPLPFLFNGSTMLRLAYGDGSSENRIVKARTSDVVITTACLAEMTVFGDATRTAPASV